MKELIKLAKLIRGANVLFSNIAQKELEEEHLVRRYRDQTDRRIVWVSLTERLCSA
ncbi:hypothetical protein [Brevibacillus formosus]|uniref:hypothetical protein n=1 Tax=Brevibacillus formosus TaxID=54913 RepID=UPI00142E0171|nr:hypothetical protein [Brevibacillus formosus]